MRRLRKVLVITTSILVVLVVTLSGLAYWEVNRAFPDYDGEAELPGLEAQVSVLRDEHGIPQIYADDAADLFRAQGYVHAQDRFWEMDFRRHVTAGRLSELFGEDQVDTDTFLRTLGWRRVAERELPTLAPDTRRYLEAYAEGVNAYVGSRSLGELGLQYTLLDLQGVDDVPERWTPVDSLAWLKAMAWDLRANVEDELTRSLMLENLPVERVEQLFPAYPYDRHRPIVADEDLPPAVTAAATTAAVRPAAQDVLPAGAAEALGPVGAALDRVPDLLGTGDGIGSNSWVVAGSRTTTGMPLLANDPHLAPTGPSIWYQMGLHCRERSAACPFDVAGFSFSGFPGIVIGHNDRIGWGFTNLGADVADLFLERVSGATYEVPGGSEALVTRTERIDVAGGDPVRVTIRETRHGPLVSDPGDAGEDFRDAGGLATNRPGAAPAPGGGDLAVALRWTALDPGRTADAVFALNSARGWDDFRAAAALFEVPAQNLVYADVDGHIGYQTPGRIPVRAGGADGRWPAAGWTGVGDWTGTIPFEQLPSVLDPAEGFVVTANNPATGPASPLFLTDDWSYGYRSERIRTRLGQAGPLDAAGMVAIQTDTWNGNAETLVPYLLQVQGLRGYDGDGQRLLQDWDLTQPADSAPAAYFNAVWRALLRLTFHDDLPPGTRPDGGDRWFEVVRGLLERPEDPFWDDTATAVVEGRDEMLRRAMLDARNDLTRRLAKSAEDWQWGRLHTLEVRDQTFGDSGIGPVEAIFNRGPYETGGGSGIVQATGWKATEGYEVDWVPSMRMVLDLADLDASRWVDLTGVSGHPYHAHYGDQTETWRTGGMLPMRFDAASIEAAAEHTLTLVPQRGD